jgi:predicted nuclease of predicted toxin-antitoxin system
MKLLFDQNLSFKLCARLVDVFPGSSQVRLEGLDQVDDRAVWDNAQCRIGIHLAILVPLFRWNGFK